MCNCTAVWKKYHSAVQMSVNAGTVRCTGAIWGKFQTISF